MAAGTVSLRYFILGLLAQQPMSGYDIRRFMKSLSWLIGSPSSGSLYPILRALLEEDLVTVETIPGLDRPPRKIYTITEAGRQELQVWVEQPAVSKAPLKAFVMRLLLAGSFSSPGWRLICSSDGHRSVPIAMRWTRLSTCRRKGTSWDSSWRWIMVWHWRLPSYPGWIAQ